MGHSALCINKHIWLSNEGKSSASFCHQLAALFPHLIWKITKLLKTQQPLRQIWNPYNFRNFLMHVWLNLKTIKFYLIKWATDLYWQTSYWLAARASLKNIFLIIIKDDIKGTYFFFFTQICTDNQALYWMKEPH